MTWQDELPDKDNWTYTVGNVYCILDDIQCGRCGEWSIYLIVRFLDIFGYTEDIDIRYRGMHTYTIHIIVCYKTPRISHSVFIHEEEEEESATTMGDMGFLLIIFAGPRVAASASDVPVNV